MGAKVSVERVVEIAVETKLAWFDGDVNCVVLAVVCVDELIGQAVAAVDNEDEVVGGVCRIVFAAIGDVVVGNVVDVVNGVWQDVRVEQVVGVVEQGVGRFEEDIELLAGCNENVVAAALGADERVEFAVVAVDEDDDVKPDDEGIDNVVAAETLDRDLDVGGYAEPVGGLAG